ncbi:murein L,D-transpeptidase [Flavobacterium sp. WC2429]|uniref:Murein L,D-transpeptidase n=1 Tax=Flavobacterium sp. WC2429 TaxID=3234140 RepID=A0AB39WNZ6_9FLAO
MRPFFWFLIVLLSDYADAAIHRDTTKNVTDKALYCISNSKEITTNNSLVTIDLITLNRFFNTYSNLKKYRSDVILLYKNRNYKSIWYDDKQLIEFANVLYSKVNQLENEGLKFNLAYKDKIQTIFNSESTNEITKTEKELLLSTLYIYYAKKVFHGIDTQKIHETGWFLPQKNVSYKTLLDSLLTSPELLDKNEKQLFGQYYKLREALKQYRQIEKSGDWKPIETESWVKEYNPGDSSKTINQIRHRLVVMGDLNTDSKSDVYDAELMAGILNFKKRNGYRPDYPIGSQHLNRMNLPIEKYIKTIMLNMERCRWIPPKLAKADEFIIINIPSFTLIYKKNGQNNLVSKVFVGFNLMETVLFSSSISRVVFSPYWNVPQSILDNEIKPAMEKDSTYMTRHHFEWNKKSLRQRPGPDNALGVVKFVFPNTYSIYLHDTPYKLNFNYDFPRFSHGCINMQKAKELAYLILADYPDWPLEKINEAMNSGVETTCVLKKPIPIHIGYFTAWVNEAGEINFYFDIYDKDRHLAELLFEDNIE